MRGPVGALVRKDRPQDKPNIWQPGAKDFFYSLFDSPPDLISEKHFFSICNNL